MMYALAITLLLSAVPDPHGIQVIDGDTIKVAGQRLRLAHIDAPELRQYGGGYDPPPCERALAQWATDALADEIARAAEVSVIVIGKDPYDRPVVILMGDGESINDRMETLGHARPWKKNNRGGWC